MFPERGVSCWIDWGGVPADPSIFRGDSEVFLEGERFSPVRGMRFCDVAKESAGGLEQY